MTKAWIVLITIFNGLVFTTAEVFTALSHTERVLNIEFELSQSLEDFIYHQERQLKILKDFSREVRGAVKLAEEKGSLSFLSHPVNSYLMIKRFVKEWPAIEKIVNLQTTAETVLLQSFEKWKQNFPDQNDLRGAITAIRRLQDVYSLEPADFSEGRFGSNQSPGYMLSPRDAFIIGRYSYIENQYEATRQWMLETLRLMDLGVRKDTSYPDREEVLDHLAFSEYKTDDIENAIVHTLEMLKLKPDNERYQTNVVQYGQVYEEKKQYYEDIKNTRKTQKKKGKHGWMGFRHPQKVFENVDWYVERDVYKRLCRGEKLPKPPQDHRRLNCWYLRSYPLCVIKRCAVERVFSNPDILILKKIITDSEISEVRKISEPLLNRATVHNPITGQLETAHYRISKNCWLSEKDGNVIQRVENRIAAMTRLDLQTAEGFQVQNYGLAGHYDPHFDFSRDLANSSLGALGTGNRLATVLVYMTQVEAGGATVFPYIGARVLPQKGDAVFWHNLLRSGEGDYRTRHAGCPVLAGIKWVANKWIHEYGNEFTRPCSLRPDE